MTTADERQRALLETRQFLARGERAWQEYERTGQSFKVAEVFGRLQRRIDARRQELLARMK